MEKGTATPSERLTLSHFGILFAAIMAPAIVHQTARLNEFLVLPLMEEFHSNRGTVMFCFSIGSVGLVFASPVVGRLFTLFQPALLMSVGVAITAIGLVISSMSGALWLVAAGYFLTHALGMVLCGSLASQTITARRFPALLGRSIGAQTVVAGLFGVVAPLVIAPLLTGYGWRATVVAMGVFSLLALPLILIFLRHEKVGQPRVKTTPAPPLAAASSTARAAPTTWQILRSPAFWLIWLALEPMTLVMGGLMMNIIPFYADRGVGVDQVKYLLSALGLVALVGGVTSGFIVDRVGAGMYLIAAAIAACIAMTCLWLDLGSPAVWICLTVLLLCGLGPTMGVSISRHFGAEGFAPAMGLLAPFMIASVFAPAGFGWMRDTMGSYHPVFALLAMLMSLSFVAGVLLHMRERRVPASAQQAALASDAIGG